MHDVAIKKEEMFLSLTSIGRLAVQSHMAIAPYPGSTLFTVARQCQHTVRQRPHPAKHWASNFSPLRLLILPLLLGIMPTQRLRLDNKPANFVPSPYKFHFSNRCVHPKYPLISPRTSHPRQLRRIREVLHSRVPAPTSLSA